MLNTSACRDTLEPLLEQAAAAAAASERSDIRGQCFSAAKSNIGVREATFNAAGLPDDDVSDEEDEDEEDDTFRGGTNGLVLLNGDRGSEPLFPGAVTLSVCQVELTAAGDGCVLRGEASNLENRFGVVRAVGAVDLGVDGECSANE
jgi:hypothetical protein